MKTEKKDMAAALPMVGPVTLWLLFFVALPLVFVAVISFCSID